MILWKQLRIPFLAITLGGVLFVLVEVILAPPANKPAVEVDSPETGYITPGKSDTLNTAILSKNCRAYA